jgi:hypothetical protein
MISIWCPEHGTGGREVHGFGTEEFHDGEIEKVQLE